MTVRRDARLGSGFGKQELWALLDELGAREPLLVGHEPDLSTLLSYLADAPAPAHAQGHPGDRGPRDSPRRR